MNKQAAARQLALDRQGATTRRARGKEQLPGEVRLGIVGRLALGTCRLVGGWCTDISLDSSSLIHMRNHGPVEAPL